MAKGVQLIGQWQAKPVTFVVKGPMRKDPADVLRLVGEKTGLRWIESDLTSPQLDRRTRAWQAVFGYGDSRLEPLIKKIEVEHPEKSYHYLSAKDLSPYESRCNKIMDRRPISGLGFCVFVDLKCPSGEPSPSSPIHLTSRPRITPPLPPAARAARTLPGCRSTVYTEPGRGVR